MELRGNMEHGLAPEPMSEPCARFFIEQAAQYSFQYFLLDLVKHKDRVHLAAVEALAKVSKVEEERQEYLNELRHGFATFRQYQGFTSTLCANWLCRIVDNYLVYVSDLLSLIFHSNPKTLKSRETITIDEVLSFNSMDELVATIAEQKVHQLSYRGMAELSDYLKERLNFPLFTIQSELALARRFVEVRNLLVHNRGVVSKISAARLVEMAPLLGKKLDVGYEEAISAAAVFARSVRDLETRAGEKFKIPQPIPNRDALIKHAKEAGPQ